jgi:two-component system cell cycle response regulator
MRDYHRPDDPTAPIPRTELDALVSAATLGTHPTLTCIEGKRVGQVYRLRPGENILGRALDADVFINAKNISRQHAQIMVSRDRCVLQDLGSTNGTYWRGEPVKAPVELATGDTIGLGGKVVLRFEMEGRADAITDDGLYVTATRDAMTGAHSLNYLLEALEIEWPWATRHNRPCALLFISLDQYSLIRECMGLNVANQLLIELAELVRPRIRKEDLFARTAPNQFCVLSRGTASEQARVLADRLLETAMLHRVEWRGERITFRVSVASVSSDDPEVSTPPELVSKGQAALEEAIVRSGPVDQPPPRRA